MSTLIDTIPVAPLTKAAFAPFGDVVEVAGGTPITINQGFAERINGLAAIDVAASDGTINVSLFEARVRPQPVAIKMMERHPLASQLFYPLQDNAWLVLVCTDPVIAATYRAFRANGRQGVNYARGVWHHPLLVLTDHERFMVVDRQSPKTSPNDNLEEFWRDTSQPLHLAP